MRKRFSLVLSMVHCSHHEIAVNGVLLFMMGRPMGSKTNEKPPYGSFLFVSTAAVVHSKISHKPAVLPFMQAIAVLWPMVFVDSST